MRGYIDAECLMVIFALLDSDENALGVGLDQRCHERAWQRDIGRTPEEMLM